MSNEIAKDLTKGPVLRQLFAFAVPVALANALQAVYSMVDMVVVGQVVGSAGLSAVGIGGQILNMFLSVGMGFSFGAQVLLSQQVGAQDRELQPTIGTLFTLEILLAVVFGLLGAGCSDLILSVMNTPEAAWADCKGYTVICCAGMLFIYGYNAVCAILRGMGESKLPMVFIAIASLVNLGLDLLFVAGFRMGASGAALATVLAQGVAFLTALGYLYRNRERFGFDFQLKSFRPQRDRLIPISKLGVPYIAQCLLITCSMMYVNAQVNAYGVTASAVDSIGGKLNTVVNIVVGAISVSGATMVGQCFGAKEFTRVKQCFRACSVICMVFCGILCAVYLLLPRQIFGLFSSDPEILDMAPRYMQIAAVWLLSMCSMTAPLSIIDGVGHSMLGLVISVLDGVVARIGLSILLGGILGLQGYWLGNALAGFVSTIMAGVYYASGRWKDRQPLLQK
jgi:putative MATE family efflux protein